MSATLNITADAEWGYRFGIDGVVTMREACELLALSHDTIKRRAAEGRLRLGNDGGRIKVCRRSIADYLSEIEG